MAVTKKATGAKKTKHLNLKTIGGYATVHFGQHRDKKMVKITIRIPRERLTERLKSLEK